MTSIDTRPILGVMISYTALLMIVVRMTFHPKLQPSARVRAWHALFRSTRDTECVHEHLLTYLRPLTEWLRTGLDPVDLVLLQCMVETHRSDEEFTGELWAAKLVSKPYIANLTYHFERENSRINRIDCPKWYVNHLIQFVRDVLVWADEGIQAAVARTGYIVDVFAHVVRELIRHAHAHIRRRADVLRSNVEWMRDTAQAYADGDAVLQGEFGYGVRFGMHDYDDPWPRLMDVFVLQDSD